MKFVLLTLIAAFSLSNTASAAQIASCTSKLEQKCKISWDLRNYLKSANECKFVDYAATDTNLIFFVGSNDRTLVAADVNSCKEAIYTLKSGTVTSQKVFEGRVFVTISSGRVAFVGRNASINELENSSGEAYSDVESVSVDQQSGSITLNRAKNQTTELTREQIQNRIKSGKLTTLAEPR